jgi:hypothetical protein
MNKLKIGDFVCIDYNKNNEMKNAIYQIAASSGFSELTNTIKCKKIIFNDDFTQMYSNEGYTFVEKRRLTPVEIEFFDNGKIKAIFFLV